MNKTIFTLALIFATAFSFAQNNIIKASLSGNLGIQYERSISKNISLAGQLGYSTAKTTASNGEENRSFGLGYTLEARYYFSNTKDRMEGWYIGPYYFKNYLKDERDRKGDFSSLGAKAGYQWVFNNNFTTEVSLGAGTIDVEGEITEIYFLKLFQFYPYFGVSIGYTF